MPYIMISPELMDAIQMLFHRWDPNAEQHCHYRRLVNNFAVDLLRDGYLTRMEMMDMDADLCAQEKQFEEKHKKKE